jgi:histone demethylase JARID1
MQTTEAKQPAMYLGECPTFYPTEEEFADPTRYIQMIRAQASPYGLCKIVPPESAERLQGAKRFGFREALQRSFGRLDPKEFKFKTKVQKIHQLQSRYGPNEAFLQDLHRFLNKKGTPMKTIPRLDGKELDLYKLFKIVVERGGARQVGLIISFTLRRNR